MLQEAITELVPGHLELGSPETVESNQEVFSDIGKSMEKLRERGVEEDVMHQAFGQALVELFVYENNKHKNDPDLLVKNTRVISHAGIEYAKGIGEDPNEHLNGLMAEACTALALNELGFTVIAPSLKEDRIGKIDMFAIDKNETDSPFVIAIQVKNSSEVDALMAHNLHDEDKLLDSELYQQNFRYLDNFKTKLAYSNKRMLRYLSQNKEKYKGRIIPLLLVIPGGKDSENSSYNTNTASPVKGFPNRLFDKIEKLIYRGEENE